MVKAPFVDKDGVKKGAWNEEEDYKLRAYIQRFGHWNWRLLPKYAGLARSGKSCRLRWVNYLKPGVKRGNYSKEEVDLIMKLHAELGNKWSAIAEKLPGRTDNGIKNYWHAHIKKRNRRNAAAICQIEQQLCEASPLMSEISHEQQHNLICSEVNSQDESAQKDLAEAESSYLQELENLVPSLNNTTCIAHDDDTITWGSNQGNFWSELCPINYLQSSTEMNYDDLLFADPYNMSPRHWLAENSTASSLYTVADTQESFWTEPEGWLFSPSIL